MIRGFYSAATALQAASLNQEATAANLAHANTPGYRQVGLTYETFDRVLGRTQNPTGDLTGTRVSGSYHDFRLGPLQQTTNPLDLALGDQDTFFTLVGPDNQTLYTRNGSFFLDQQGAVVSQGGYRLQSDGGAITIPPGTAIIHVAADGAITADGVPIGKLQLARFANPNQLTNIGPTLFTANDQVERRPAADGQVMQGYREGSNVNPADAMVQLIIGSRYYDAAQRSLRAISDSIQLNTRPNN